MKRNERTRLNATGVIAMVALAFAVGLGGAYAGKKITAKKIAANAVLSKHIKDGQVATGDLAPGAVTSPAIARGAVTSPAIARGAVTSPAIGENAVDGSKVADASISGEDIAGQGITGADIAVETIDTDHIRESAVRSDEIANFGIQAQDIDVQAVGSGNLKLMTTAVSSGTAIGAGQTGTATVTCPGGRRLIAGGFAWNDSEQNSIIASAPSEGSPATTWTVKGLVPSGSNTLFAWATCLSL